MNKYPYIGKNSNLCGDFSIAIFYGEKRGALLENTIDEIPLHEHILNFNEREFKNITSECLANTYGKVESKEHAEFIVKLAEVAKCAGLEVAKHKIANVENFKGICFNFYTDNGSLWFAFHHEGQAKNRGEKLITIPLPPKEKSMEPQKEWPAVGDEVLYDGSSERLNEIKGEIVKVIGKYSFDTDNYVTVKHSEHGVFAMRLGSWIKKSPTPEEELRTKLISVMDNSNTAFAYADFISKAIINGEIEGLEYKPQ